MSFHSSAEEDYINAQAEKDEMEEMLRRMNKKALMAQSMKKDAVTDVEDDDWSNQKFGFYSMGVNKKPKYDGKVEDN